MFAYFYGRLAGSVWLSTCQKILSCCSPFLPFSFSEYVAVEIGSETGCLFAHHPGGWTCSRDQITTVARDSLSGAALIDKVPPPFLPLLLPLHLFDFQASSSAVTIVVEGHLGSGWDGWMNPAHFSTFLAPAFVQIVKSKIHSPVRVETRGCSPPVLLAAVFLHLLFFAGMTGSISTDLLMPVVMT